MPRWTHDGELTGGRGRNDTAGRPAERSDGRRARAGKREWKDLSPLAKVAVVVGATIQLGLLVAALVDLFRRRPDQINGPRALWVAVSSVNFVGPIAYFLFGRRRS